MPRRSRMELFSVAGALLLACSADTPTRSRSSSTGGTPPPAGTGSSAAGSGSFGNPNTPSPTGPPGMAVPGAVPQDVCEVVHVNANPLTPDMLIVLDRSRSMTDGGRWMPSVSALQRVTMELQSRIRFGLAMFPDPAALDPATCLMAPDPFMCIAGAGCAPGKLVVDVAPDNAAAINAALNMTMPLGGTPTGDTLQSLVGTYSMPVADPDGVVHPKFILLVTDGQPTCPAGMGMNTMQPDIDLANNAIDMLTAMGVRTYVIGYDTTGPGNEMFAAVLDGFAQRGGTGDTMHRPVEDEQSLLTELQTIAGGIVGCNFTLDEAPPRPDFVLVRLDGQQINLNDPNGWVLVGDREVQLNGAACATFKDGGTHAVDVEVRCSVVVPI